MTREEEKESKCTWKPVGYSNKKIKKKNWFLGKEDELDGFELSDIVNKYKTANTILLALGPDCYGFSHM